MVTFINKIFTNETPPLKPFTGRFQAPYKGEELTAGQLAAGGGNVFAEADAESDRDFVLL